MRSEASAPTPESSNLGLAYLAITVLGLAGAAWFGYSQWSTSARPDLDVNGSPITNAQQILDDADGLFRGTAEADGAPIRDGAKCFFAKGNGAPQVVCGPVWLGASPEEQPWLQVETSYETNEDEVLGEVGAIRGTTTAESRGLVRPDGGRPIGVGDPQRPDTGPRRSNGTRLVGAEDVLTGAEDALDTAMATAEEDVSLNLSDQTRCFFREGPDLIHGLPMTDDNVWCGPARTVGSDADEIWVPVAITYQRGPTFGSVIFESARPNLVARALVEGSELARPDGTLPSDPEDVDRPPVPTDFAQVVDFQVPTDGSSESGRLVTERYRIDFSEVQRVKTIGSGERSFTAGPGRDLVVASIAPTEAPASPRGSLAIDGLEVPLPNWRTGENGGTLVVSVPEDATSVDMVVEDDGRPQTISLLDGELAEGFPLALYRPEAEVNQPVSIRIDMPLGEAVLVSGRITTAEWSARNADGEWLPEGDSDLIINFDSWDVDTPCCDVDFGEVVSSFTVLDGTPPAEPDPEAFDDLRDEPAERPSSRSPRFRTPEDLAEAVLLIEVEVDITVDGTESTESAQLELMLDLP